MNRRDSGEFRYLGNPLDKLGRGEIRLCFQILVGAAIMDSQRCDHW